MKTKHVQAYIEMCLTLSKLSNCPRRKFGALLIEPERNLVLGTGYNGAPRGGGDLCGGDCCLRDAASIPSGQRVEVGCVHAEMNVIANAASNGIAAKGAWLIVTGEPCVMCAKLIRQTGIARVIIVGGGYAGENGLDFLREHGVEITAVEGPQDPRANRV